MGGGDLNTKKSWHPSTFKNQERVWKAEQADAAEKRKLAELQHEINEERNREELKTIAKKSGLLPDDGSGDRKLEWMYKGPAVNREEYLLGRTVDKTFETMDAQEKASAAASGSGVGISQPKNHVEHECIPFSIRQYKGLEGTEQVDIVRKLMEDPLMQIKQKEVESRQKILENPVKLKELHRLLKSDQSIRGKDRERDRKGGKKKDKKDKKSMLKKRKGSESSDGSDDSGGGDLDKILAEKYKKVQNSMEKQEEVSLDKLLSMKYQKLSKELNKMAKPKKSKKKKDRRRSRSSDDSESDSDSDGREPAKRRRDSSRDRNRPGPSRVRERSRSQDRHRRNRSKSPKRREERKRSRSPARKSPKSSREPAPRGRRTPVPSSSSESSPEPSHRRRNDSDDEDERRPKPKNFGLVSASGKKLELNKRDEVRLYKREEIKAHQSSQKPTWTRPERKAAPLTEEEMEAKRRAMMSNAEWRDRERQQNVKRYDDEDRKLEERDGPKRYDKDFVMKQFKHAANNETVEKRIKSNRNNIQRSGGSMNDNFARR
ncbi:hypothetical protein pipiens_016667 [Culex pipiens pipiens]|uniref:CBF1-interacting co-repressor CIR N-terminal domain-containing protein n=1 Tax=Culex pipiens pipiens TaxID=38569 RepID=A0ABD1CL60_CULPP